MHLGYISLDFYKKLSLKYNDLLHLEKYFKGYDIFIKYIQIYYNMFNKYALIISANH